MFRWFDFLLLIIDLSCVVLGRIVLSVVVFLMFVVLVLCVIVIGLYEVIGVCGI